MNKSIVIAGSFIFGVAVGACGMWLGVKRYYQQIADEEIESVRELYGKSHETHSEPDNSVAPEKPEVKQDDITDYKREVDTTNYGAYFASLSPEKRDEKAQTEILEPRPYIIAPSEFGMGNDYDLITIDYFKDGTLIFDVDDSTVEDIENVIGSDSVNHFGEYEDDAVYVRNDRLKFDYEILRREETYEEYLEMKENAPAGMIV